MSKIGFIGLGNMGGPMVKNLVEAGHSVAIYDIDDEATTRAVSYGGIAKSDAVGTIQNAETVITMLPAGEHVRSVYLENDNLIEHVNKHCLLIDCSTIDVSTAREVIALAKERDIEMIDAPVSGGVGGAEAATLTFMCGGTDSAFNKAQPLLQVMGKNIFHAGSAGSGQAAKVCNNLMLGIEMVAVSEGFVLADKLGLDKQKLWDIASTATSQCWAMTNYCPVPGPVPSSPANRDYKAGFTIAMMLKDLKLSQEAAKTNGAFTPLASLATDLYESFATNDKNEDLDFSSIIKLIENK